MEQGIVSEDDNDEDTDGRVDAEGDRDTDEEEDMYWSSDADHRSLRDETGHISVARISWTAAWTRGLGAADFLSQPIPCS